MEKHKSIKIPCDSITPTCNLSNSITMPSIDVSQPPEAFDLIYEVKVLQRLNSEEISKLLKDNENRLLLHILENGSTLQVDMERLVRFLPLHLTAVLLSSQNDEAMLRYLLSGLRLLHSLCEIATRHPKLEQILLDDVRVSEQLLDMVFYVLILSSSCKQEYHFSGAMPLLYAAIVACSIYLLTACISSQWNDLAFVLHAHPKVDIFIDVAFGAVRRNINFIQSNLSADDYTIYSNSILAVEREVYFCCQQCEASLQFLQQICQNKSFHDRLLKNKELCRKGGVLRLVQAALNLNTPPILKESCAVVAAISRLKARVLSILLYLCEAESVSYLDDVAGIPESLDLAKSVALEVIELLKTMMSSDLKRPENYSGKTYPMGLLQLNALRLADIFSDDSNLRSYITIYFAEVLAFVLSVPYQQFLSNWCSSDLPLKEEDVSLDYEPFTVAGWVLDLSSPSNICNVEMYESNFIPIGNAPSFYAYQRTSLLVKVIANLHCFVPNICKEQERNLFLQKFLDHLRIECQDPQIGDSLPFQQGPRFSFNSAPRNAATVCKNLRSLLGHAESLIPTFLEEEDVQLLRVFFTQVQSLIGPTELEVNRGPEMQNVRDCSSPFHGVTELDIRSRNSLLREGMSENSAFAGVCDPCVNDEHASEVDGVMQDANICESKSSKSIPERLDEVEKEAQNAANSYDEHVGEVDGVMQDANICEGKSSKSILERLDEVENAAISYDEHVGEVDTVIQDVNVCKGKSSKALRERLPEVEKEVQNTPDINDDGKSSKDLLERLPEVENNPDINDEHCRKVDAVMQDVNKCEGKSSQALLERVDEVQNAETSGSDISSSRGKHVSCQDGNGEITKSSDHSYKSNSRGSLADEKTESLNCEEKQTKKRKRPIMNDTQASLFVRAVHEEPDIHKKASSLQSWAAKLSCHGSEVTPTQLKNWLNNRKAKLARRAAKNGPISSEDPPTAEHQDGSATRPSNMHFTGSRSSHATDQNQISTDGTTILGAKMNRSAKRKAKIARRAAKNGLTSSEDPPIANHQDGSTTHPSSNLHSTGSGSGNGTDQSQIATVGTTSLGSNTSQSANIVRPECSTQSNPQKFQVSNFNCVRLAAGQRVILTGTQGKEVAKGQNQLVTAGRTFLGANIKQTSETVLPKCSTQSNTENCQVSNSNCTRLAAGEAVLQTATQGKEIANGQNQILSVGETFLGANVSQHGKTVSPESSTQTNPQNCQGSNSNCARLTAGQAVVLTDSQGKEIAKGMVFQVEGEWQGCNLAETSTCVVDISDLRSDRIVRHPHPSVAGGPTYEAAEVSVGNMRVLWDFSRIRVR